MGELQAFEVYAVHNQISYIAGGAFRSMGNLEVLELAGNEISWTIDMNAAFEVLTSLLRLDLNNNHIKSISTTSFSGLVQLRHLQLVNNNITSIQEDAFADLVSLEQIKFNTSTLLCDCQLKWLPIWLQQKQLEAMVSARCGHPRTLQGSSILDVSQEDFTCTDFPKPVMVTEPTAVIALKGNNMSLSCAVQSSSDSPMKAEWRKNSVPMHNANVENFASLRNDNVNKLTSILHLTHVQDVDSGSYQCIVTNQFGSVFSKKARVNVYVYPVFTKTPLDVSVKAGKTARLECAAHGEPQPEVFWQKDGGEDFPAARERRMMFAREDDVFFILKVSSLDQGLYSCMARNGAGTIIANATLTVFENPSFVKPMEDKQTKVGETTVLECLAAGSPKPKLTWLKNDKPLGVTERHFFTANDQLLVIVQTRPEDAGRYTCEMSNTLGMERGTSQLTVINLESPSRGNNGGGLDDESTTTGIIIIAVVCCVVGTSLVWVIIIYQTRKRSDTYSSTPTDETTLPGDLTPYNPSDEERESSKSDQFLEYQGHVLPMFQSHPRGKTARLECAAHGEPQPEVFWQKDGGEDFPAARERRMMFAREDDVFFILKVSSLDQGLYSCMARNGAGTIIANATLTVFENPSFVKPMEDKQTKVGETTVLECLAAGSPKPKLTWLKNDKPLGVTERHFFTANDQLLVIVQTRPEDAGRYTCEMSNTLGMERGTSQLTVINLESPSRGNNGGGLDDESTTTGIIIIAVVCCVVGTSLVWVIIIYQTRKRSDTYSSTPTDETTLPGDLTPYNPSDEERESSKSDQFLEYQGHVLPMFQSHPRYAKAECGRTAAIFPSDVEDDDLKQSVPLTCDEHQPAAESEHSINSLSLPSSASDSSSPSTRSTSSTGLNSLQTFNPHPKLANHNGVRDRSPSPVAMIHQPPQWFNASSLPHTRSTADSYHCSKSPTDNPEPPAPHTASLPQYSCVPGHNSHTTSHTLPIPYEDLYPDSEVHPNHHSSSASSPKSPSHHTSSNSSSHPQLSHLSSHHNIDSGDIPSENNHNHRHFDSAERRHRGRQAPPIGGRSQHRQHGGRTLSSPSQQHHRHLYVNPMDETLETAGSIPEVGLKSPSSKQKVALPHRTGDDRV
ncbi:leucine-rich repeats and immunoglobulin-like domains protein 3 [Lingula anatina]|uniref:Leucine-rich repeats and immunoglobulin-like domains protein 3 n=1 Tax=Lingula anatina TaxID=7574 RepID=A0A1S3IK26_LINAN|nr:leucine-rich repeats and immunoglobulin-like domains protein 3 [Lingula anatina]|eukprot:XP_013398463.1 leucine-rich repeats and immunoglobulin-like domains protein 3 [Lingula anatina]